MPSIALFRLRKSADEAHSAIRPILAILESGDRLRMGTSPEAAAHSASILAARGVHIIAARGVDIVTSERLEGSE